MSKESAIKFLADAALDDHLRNHFINVDTPEKFIKIAQECGYQFTTEELHEVIKEHSEGILIRRQTGIWKWLRNVKWR